MSDKKIHLPGKCMKKLQPGQQPVVRLTIEAYDHLMEIVNETSLSTKDVLSEIILQCGDLIVFDREEE